MSERQTVIVVATGEYENYEVRRIFTSMESAQPYIDSFLEPPEVCEWTLDMPFNPDLLLWAVTMRGDLSVVHVGRSAENQPSGNACWEDPAFSYSVIQEEPMTTHNRLVWVGIIAAPTRQRAIEIAAEQVAAKVAQTAGGGAIA